MSEVEFTSAGVVFVKLYDSFVEVKVSGGDVFV